MNKRILFSLMMFSGQSAFAGYICGGGLLFSPDNKYFVAGWGASESTISFGLYKDKKYFKSVTLPSPCLYAVSPDSRRVAAGVPGENKLLMLSLKGEILQELEVGAVTNISRRFRYLATVKAEGQGNTVLTVSDFSEGGYKPRYVLSDMSDKGWSDFSPDERYFAYYYGKLARDGNIAAGFINVIDLKTGKSAANLSFPGDSRSPIRALRFSPDGKMLAYGSSQGEVRVISCPGWKPVKIIKDRGYGGVEAIRIAGNGAYMAVLYANEGLKVYSVPGFEAVSTKKYESTVLDLGFSADSGTLGVLFVDGRLNFVRLGGGAGAL